MYISIYIHCPSLQPCSTTFCYELARSCVGALSHLSGTRTCARGCDRVYAHMCAGSRGGVCVSVWMGGCMGVSVHENVSVQVDVGGVWCIFGGQGREGYCVFACVDSCRVIYGYVCAGVSVFVCS